MMDMNIICAYLGLVVTQLIYAGSSPVLKVFGEGNGADPFMYVLYRNLDAVLVTFAIALLSYRRIEIPTKRELVIFMIIGVLAMVIQIDHILGVYLLSADMARLSEPTAPVWAILFEAILKLENIPSMKTLDGILKATIIILGILGTVITVLGKLEFKYPKRPMEIIIGYCLLISCPSVRALEIATTKKYILTQEDNRWKNCPFFLTAWIRLFSALSSAALSLFYVNQPQKFLSIKGSAFIPLVYLMLLNSIVAFTLKNWCTLYLSASTVTAFWPLQVAFCVLLSYIFIGEVLTVPEVLGSITICIALLVTVLANYKKKEMQIKTDNF